MTLGEFLKRYETDRGLLKRRYGFSADYMIEDIERLSDFGPEDYIPAQRRAKLCSYHDALIREWMMYLSWQEKPPKAKDLGREVRDRGYYDFDLRMSNETILGNVGWLTRDGDIGTIEADELIRTYLCANPE